MASLVEGQARRQSGFTQFKRWDELEAACKVDQEAERQPREPDVYYDVVSIDGWNWS